MPPIPPPRRAGFTLLEMIVALAILGLTLAILAQGLRLGELATLYNGRLDAGADELETTSRALRGMLERAAPGDTSTRTETFSGDADSVSFVTSLPARPGLPAMTQADVTLRVMRGALVLLWRPHYPRWTVPPPALAAVPLLRHVARFAVAYAAPGAPWVRRWGGPNLPALVRLKIGFQAGDRRHWPAIVAIPMRDANRP